MKDGQYLSTRSGGSGLGLKSITSTAAKYGGMARFYHESNEFCSDVMIPIGKTDVKNGEQPGPP